MRELLANTYGWFTEGFGTNDLQEAKSLLEEIQQEDSKRACPERVDFSPRDWVGKCPLSEPFQPTRLLR